MLNEEIVEYAIARIQEKEELPDIGAELANQLSRLSRGLRASSSAPDEQIEDELRGLVLLLDSIPANYSLPFVTGLYGHPVGNVICRYIESTRDMRNRMEFLERLMSLLDLFSEMRLARIRQTLAYIESGWGWKNVC